METKQVKWKKHPYMFELNVVFGTFEDMKENAYQVRKAWEGINTQMWELKVGGTFNENIRNGGRRGEYYFGLEIITTYGKKWNDITEADVKSAKIVNYNDWEGTYGYRDVDGIEDCKPNAQYPVAANWNGVTYIERSKRNSQTDELEYYYEKRGY